MDGLWGTLFGLSALGALSGDETGAGVALAGASALFIASAVRGNNAANACRDEYGEYNATLMAQQRNFIAQEPVVPRPSPAVKKKPKKPPVEQPPVEQVEPTPPAPEPEPAPEEQPAPEYATPRPPVKSPVPIVKQPPAPKQPPPPKKNPDDEDWSDFWKEVP